MSDKLIRLELGCGGRRIHKATDGLPDEINIAIDFYQYNETDPDIIWDLRYGLPWGKKARGVVIEKGTVDDIFASHVLEHIGRPVDPKDDLRVGLWKLMADCYDALKMEGTLRGAVPFWPDPTSILDPTHYVSFRPETFSYFGWHDRVNEVTVGWVPGFRPDDNRVFEPVEVADHGNQIGFILKKVK